MEEFQGFFYCDRCYWVTGDEEETMTKRRKKGRRQQEDSGVAHAEALLGALQARAMSVGAKHQHILGVWHSSKKQFGKASRAAMCTRCSQQAVIMPYGVVGAGLKPRFEGRPTLGGKALIYRCPQAPPADGEIKQGVLLGER
jgi:hypothetical protein